MARFHTPVFGEFAGRLCKDGVPVAELPADYLPPLTVALPDFVPSDEEARYRRGIDGAALTVYAEHQRRGSDQTYESCRARVVAARSLCQRKKE